MVIEPIEIGDLVGQRIIIDGHLILHQFLASIRSMGVSGDGGPLRGPDGSPVSHLMGLLARVTNLLQHGVNPIIVFDGDAHQLKDEVIAQRRKRRVEATEEWQALIDAGELEAARKKGQQAIHLTREMVDEAKLMLSYLGIPVIQAAAEGEGEAAVRVRRNQADAVATQDWDALLYGTPVLIRNLMSAGSRRRGKIVNAERIYLSKVLDLHQISHEQLVDIAIMIGTDFHKGVKGIGPKRGLSQIKKHGAIEAIIEDGGYESIENLDTIRSIFLNHPCSEQDISMPGIIDEEGLRNFLIDKKGFSEKRVSNAIATAGKKVRTVGQTRLTDFV